jgi:hypothetical protein
MAIDNDTYNEISSKLVSAIDQIWKERNAEDIGPVIASAFCRMGASMFFYCSEDKTAAAIATLEATAAGIEEAMRHKEADMHQAASATLQ